MSDRQDPHDQIDGWRGEVDRWREARLFRLRSPTGWLSLVDRVLLDQGDTALDIGVATRTGEVVRLRPHRGIALAVNGQPVTEHHWRPGAPETEAVDSGGRRYELLRRGMTLAIRVKDPAAPLLRDFRGLAFFPTDPRWRVVASFEPYRPPRTTRHVYDLGEGEERIVPGLVRFGVDGQDLSLEPVIDDNGRRLFFVFGDGSNRKDSYPGGRFLYADLPGPDGQVVLDFNLAFNPPCAFTAFASCPAISPANRLPLAVPAGERYRSVAEAD